MSAKGLFLSASKESHPIWRMKQLVGALMIGSLMAFAPGCASDRPQRTARESIDDQSAARRVQERLNSDPAYKFTEVKVVAYQGKVQLSGFVDKGEQKG